MSKSIEDMINSLSHEDFLELVESIPDDELKHWGVLGMKWGVRKDRVTGKKVGTPAAGTERAKHSTPSVSPGDARKTASGEVELRVRDRKVVVNLNQTQKSKLGSKGLDLEDLSIEQLRAVSERMRLQTDIISKLEGSERDQAMQAVVNRIKLEQEYAKLTAAPPTRRQRFLKTSGEIVKSVAKTQATALLNAAAKQQIDSFLKTNGIKPIASEKKGSGIVGFQPPKKKKD